MSNVDIIVKRRYNKATGDVSLTIPAEVRNRTNSTFYNVEVEADGCLLYRPINVSSPAVVPTKDPTAGHTNEHSLTEVVASE